MGRRPAEEAAALVVAVEGVVLEEAIEIGLDLLDPLVPGLPAFDAATLVERGGVSELRIDIGPGYRVDFVAPGQEVVVLLLGGDEESQEGDIRRARELAGSPREGPER